MAMTTHTLAMRRLSTSFFSSSMAMKRSRMWGHAEVAETPCQRGDDVQQTVGGGGVVAASWLASHGQVAGQATGVVQNHVPAACHADTIRQHRHQRHAHDDGLDEVGGGHRAEAAQDGVTHDDQADRIIAAM